LINTPVCAGGRGHIAAQYLTLAQIGTVFWGFYSLIPGEKKLFQLTFRPGRDDETLSHPAIKIKFNHPNGMSPPRQPLKPLA
jgi:hypothetical protein